MRVSGVLSTTVWMFSSMTLRPMNTFSPQATLTEELLTWIWPVVVLRQFCLHRDHAGLVNDEVRLVANRLALEVAIGSSYVPRRPERTATVASPSPGRSFKVAMPSSVLGVVGVDGQETSAGDEVEAPARDDVAVHVADASRDRRRAGAVDDVRAGGDHKSLCSRAAVAGEAATTVAVLTS